MAAFFIAFSASTSAGTPTPKMITEEQALQIAKKQLVTARPDLGVKDPVPRVHFVPAGPSSGGGPKWVIGFQATDRNWNRKGIYCVTVFTDGRTSEKEIRQAPDMGPSPAQGLSVTPFPDGTVLYKAIGARIATLSPIKSDADSSEKALRFTFKGKWELNPELQGVSVTPDAGAVIGARTDEEKKKLIEMESRLKKRGNQEIDIYILSGSVNRDGVTYASPETVRFE